MGDDDAVLATKQQDWKAAQRALAINSDLDDGVVRSLGLELGFVDVKVAAIDTDWSGLKVVWRKELRVRST